jgi:hypothetical protein
MTMIRRTLLQLAFTYFDKGLAITGSVDGERIAQSLANAGIQRIGFLRHGNTAPANGGDSTRQLSDLGKEQVKEAANSFGKDLRPFFPLMIVSPASRTMETSSIFLRESGFRKEIFEFETDDILYDGTMQPKGSKLFQKIGYAPLSEYLAASDQDDRRSAQSVLGAYAADVSQLLFRATLKSSHLRVPDSGERGSTLWLIGHAIYLPAVVLNVASLLNCDSGQELILSTNTREAEGYLLDIARRKVELLIRDSNKT